MKPPANELLTPGILLYCKLKCAPSVFQLIQLYNQFTSFLGFSLGSQCFSDYNTIYDYEEAIVFAFTKIKLRLRWVSDTQKQKKLVISQRFNYMVGEV